MTTTVAESAAAEPSRLYTRGIWRKHKNNPPAAWPGG